jgi:hypothetical protein
MQGTVAGTVWRKIRSGNLNRNRVKMARFRNTDKIVPKEGKNTYKKNTEERLVHWNKYEQNYNFFVS